MSVPLDEPDLYRYLNFKLLSYSLLFILSKTNLSPISFSLISKTLSYLPFELMSSVKISNSLSSELMWLYLKSPIFLIDSIIHLLFSSFSRSFIDFF